jgi:phosphatidylserine/phosphatidylglycerophosphate/cardiolipin synthase-like enzyme
MAATFAFSGTTYWSPWDDTTQIFMDFIAGTKRSLFIVVFGFHLPKLTDLLLAQHEKGIEHGLILDLSQSEGHYEKDEVQRLVDAKFPFLVGTSPIKHAIIHNKFAIRDERDVEHGSWNFSLSASNEANDITLALGSPEYAAGFLHHYHRLHAFIALSQMALQPAGATSAPDTGVAA